MQAPSSFRRTREERRLLARWLPTLDRGETEVFNERAAIREHDGHLSRHAAEFGAIEDVMRDRGVRWLSACLDVSDEEFAAAEAVSRAACEAEIERQAMRWGSDRRRRWDRARSGGLGIEAAFAEVVGGDDLARVRHATWQPTYRPAYPEGVDEVLALNWPAFAEDLAERDQDERNAEVA